MDMISILFATVGGAIGGGIGALLGKKYQSKNAKIIAMVIPIVFLSLLAGELAKVQSVRDIISPPSKMEKAVRAAGEILENNEAFKKEIAGKPPGEISAFVEKKVQLGLKRLSVTELRQWNRLRVLLAEADEALCAGFWTGKILKSDILGTMDKLREPDLKAWFEISMKAAALEMDQAPFDSPSETAFQDSVQAVSDKLDEADQQRMNRTLEAGTEASTVEACWTMLTLLKGVEQLSPHQQEQMLKSLASI